MDMKSPTIYSEWVESLLIIQKDGISEETIRILNVGSLEWTTGVAERITNLLHTTLKVRLDHLTLNLQKELNLAEGNTDLIVKSLMNARNRLYLMNELTKLPIFPSYVQKEMGKVLINFSEQVQDSLIKGVATDRTGTLKMLFLRNSLTNFKEIESPLSDLSKLESVATVPNEIRKSFKTSKRRVILNE
ncbi:hypothetical protein LG275_13095 [Chryseomicrobium palamuruense]